MSWRIHHTREKKKGKRAKTSYKQCLLNTVKIMMHLNVYFEITLQISCFLKENYI